MGTGAEFIVFPDSPCSMDNEECVLEEWDNTMESYWDGVPLRELLGAPVEYVGEAICMEPLLQATLGRARTAVWSIARCRENSGESLMRLVMVRAVYPGRWG